MSDLFRHRDLVEHAGIKWFNNAFYTAIYIEIHFLLYTPIGAHG